VFEQEFFSDAPASLSVWKDMLLRAMATLEANLPAQPYSGLGPREIAARLPQELLPRQGRTADEAFAALGEILRYSVAVWHPHTLAHLHCPVVLPAPAAEVVLTALNQSMDSFDQAPAATVVEQQISDWLCRLAAMPAGAGATFTGGGAQSNHMGLLLARDTFSQKHWGHRASPASCGILR